MYLDIPTLGTTHTDCFYGNIHCTRSLIPEEIKQGYEWNTGRVIAEKFKNLDLQSVACVLVKNHGPFAWRRCVLQTKML